MKRESRLAYRERLRTYEWWIIDKLLPGNTVHTCVGNSGTGKTTWLLQMLHDWERGLPVLGYDSNPCNWCYISFDRATHETDKTLRRIGLSDWDAPIYSIEELTNINEGYSIDTILSDARFAQTKLFVIEGLQALTPAPAPRQSQNQAEMQWMTHLRQKLFQSGRSIIFVTHPPKSKKNESYASSRSEILGSQSIGATTSTMIKVSKIEDSEQDQRLVQFDGRDFKDFAVLYDIDSTGKFVNPTIPTSTLALSKESSLQSSINESNLDLWLLAQPRQPMQTRFIEMFAESQGISRATTHRWLASAEKRKLIAKIAYGMWQKTLDPTLNP